MSPNAAQPIYTFLPLIQLDTGWSDHAVAVVPVVGPPLDRPALINPDINLAVRAYVPAAEPPTWEDYTGEVDPDAPQLAALFAPARMPALVATYQVYDWDWACGPDGARADPIDWPPVTLLGLQTSPGETLYIPARRAEIYGGGSIALVLFADPTRITLHYGREDSPAMGYILHLEGLQVDPAIVRCYEEMNDSGRHQLPALRNGERVGRAAGAETMIAVRDTGSFLDPRSRKDWWQGWSNNQQ